MQSPVSMRRDGEIAVVTIDNPPVNALSHSVRVGFLEILPHIESDPELKAILLVCAGSSFSAGADVREFGAPPRDPIMAVAMAALESSAKLTVAAIHGQALGGGLETALVFDYRCAVASARIGLPEIKLGLFPGGGGTQRLPRLIGMDAAADVILSGEVMSVVKGKALGMIDALIEGELVDGALEYTRHLLEQGAPRRRLCEWDAPAAPKIPFAARRAQALKDTKGLPAAAAAVDALQAAIDRPFAEGLAEERRLFMIVRDSDEAAALRYVFAAERAAAKLPFPTADLQVKPLAVAAVIGAGTMGTGIAIALANAGLGVTLIDATEAGLARGFAHINSNYQAQVARGRMSQTQCDAMVAAITPTLEFDAAADADIVIECVFEDMAIKRDVFARLGKIAKPDAVLATNTSALDIDAIAAASERAADVVGMHFFSPANIMRLVEVVRGAGTSPEVLGTAMALCKRIGKIGVLARNCDGFIGNRMLRGYRREAEFLVLEGAAPAAVDKVLTDFGMAMGVHAMGDMAGLDISAAGRRRLREAGLLTDQRVGVVQDKLVEMGRLGLKSGRGIYRYEDGSRVPMADAEAESVIVAEAAKLGVQRRTIQTEEILQRCLIALVNEGARIIDEGVALGAADIDVVYCNGYGFPRHRGGPMFWADRFGLAKIIDCMEGFRRELGAAYWTPAPLLVRLAERGGSFGGLQRGERA